MIRKRTFYARRVADVFHQERFYPSGSYSWSVPEGCTSVDVFLVGGGGGTGNIASGGGGYTKTYKSSTSGYRDGGPITVSAGQRISIIVGSGGDSVDSEDAKGYDGGYSQFMSSSYRANGCSGGEYAFVRPNYYGSCGDGGGGGCGWFNGTPGSDGVGSSGGSRIPSGESQGHTTRDFGESSGSRNAGGGGSGRGAGTQGINTNAKVDGGASDYSAGTGSYCIDDEGHRVNGGGGYGGGASGGAMMTYYGPGGDGTVLIRYYAYK